MKKPGEKVRDGSEQYKFLKEKLEDGYFATWCDDWRKAVAILLKYAYNTQVCYKDIK
jgi:hypothetical protein